MHHQAGGPGRGDPPGGHRSDAVRRGVGGGETRARAALEGAGPCDGAVDEAQGAGAGGTDRDVEVAVTVEVAHGQGLPVAVRLRLPVVDDGARPGETGRGAPDGDDRTAVGVAVDILAGRADQEVGIAVLVQVGGGDGAAERVARLGGAGHAGRVLGDQGAGGRPQPGGAAVDDRDGTRRGLAADRRVGGADREVGAAVAVEVVRDGGRGRVGGGDGQGERGQRAGDDGCENACAHEVSSGRPGRGCVIARWPRRNHRCPARRRRGRR